MRPHVDGRSELKLHRAAGDHAVVDIRRILAVRKDHTFFDGDALHFIGPDRQTGIDTEVDQMLQMVRVFPVFCFQAIERDNASIRRHREFEHIVQHHRAPERSRQGSDQIAMEDASRSPADSS